MTSFDRANNAVYDILVPCLGSSLFGLFDVGFFYFWEVEKLAKMLKIIHQQMSRKAMNIE